MPAVQVYLARAALRYDAHFGQAAIASHNLRRPGDSKLPVKVFDICFFCHWVPVDSDFARILAGYVY